MWGKRVGNMRTHRFFVALLAWSTLSPALAQQGSAASLLERYALPSGMFSLPTVMLGVAMAGVNRITKELFVC